MRHKTMDLFHDNIEHRRHNKLKNIYMDALKFRGDLYFVVINLPVSWILKLFTRALFLTLVIVSLPWLNTMIGDLTSKLNESAKISSSNADQLAQDPINLEILSMLFHDLSNEGLLKKGDRGLIFSNAQDEDILKTQVFSHYNMDMISYSDSSRQSLIPNEVYDFMFVHDFHVASKEFVERTLKKDGIVTIQLCDNPMVSFSKPSNYKIVYMRRFGFDSTIIAMRKLSHDNQVMDATNSLAKRRRLLGLTTEVKKKALNNLEDVLLEPPRAASGRSNTYQKRTRFLPDLIGDSLKSYPRRVFIDVGLADKIDPSSDVSWFSKNYPTKNTKFEMYKIETVTEEPSRKEVAQIGMSDWLRKNLKGNEYVVMKAEAEVVEELVRSKAIKLVDELFLECKHRGIKKSVNRSRRAYWECLALYGMLRDEGIAVHQWWG